MKARGLRYQIRIPEAGRPAERIPENLPADQDLKAAVPEEEAAAPAAAVPVAVR